MMNRGLDDDVLLFRLMLPLWRSVLAFERSSLFDCHNFVFQMHKLWQNCKGWSGDVGYC